MSLDEIAEEFFPPDDDKPRLGPGLYDNVSHEDYHADPCERPSLSASMAHLLATESPEEAYTVHPRLGGYHRPGTRDMDRGTILHLLMLGRGQAFHEIEANDYKTKSAQIARKHAEEDGLVPVLSRELAEYRRICDIFRGKLAKHRDHLGRPEPIVLDGLSEVTGIWEDEGVLCRLRADHWKPDALTVFDVKTTLKSIAPDRLVREMFTYGNDIQHTAYTRGMGKIAGAEGRVRMLFLFLQVRPPYGVVVIEPAGTMEQLGDGRWRRSRDLWKACLAAHTSNDPAVRETAWPGHGANQTVRLYAQPWMLAADTEAEIARMGNEPPDF